MPLKHQLIKSLKSLEKPYIAFNEITLSKKALLSNFDFFKSLNPKGHVIPVLKSNAYGHGILEISEILKDRSFPYIAVDGYYEALVIREYSRQPVLVMGAIHPDNFKRIKLDRFTFVVHDQDTIEALASTGRAVKIHIEVDTGMSRHGVSLGDLPKLLETISKYPDLVVDGVMSHLADADNPTDNSYTKQQTDKFDRAVSLVLEAGFNPKYIHLAQSAGSTKVKSKYANAMRIGIALYGINPLEPSDKNYKKLQPIQPVLSLISTITKVSTLESGTSVSYGRTYTAKEPTTIGVIPVGYYEGLPRELSNMGSVEYKDKQLPIAGRVCMNHTMIDLGKTQAKVGDRVRVISRDKSSPNSIDQLSRKHKLFNYSLLIGLAPTIRRRVID